MAYLYDDAIKETSKAHRFIMTFPLLSWAGWVMNETPISGVQMEKQFGES